MKHIDKKYRQLGFIFTLSVCFCILFYFTLFNGETLLALGSSIISTMSPFIYGFFIAYLLNPLMNKTELKVVKPVYGKLHNKNKKYKDSLVRLISVLISIILFLLFLYALIIMIGPQVIESIESIITKCPEYFESFKQFGNKIVADNKDLAQILIPYSNSFEQWFMDSILPKMQEFVTSASTNIIGGVYSTISQVFNIILGIIIAAFLMCNKEVYCAQAKKITYALLREERANNLINNARFANKTFGGFLNGKIIDSLVIGILTFIVLIIFKIPYSVLIAVVIGITNIIPVFGPFLGAIPSAMILLMVDPMKALTFIVIIFVIQQLDGNLIGPYILGDSTGLSSFWVIFAITVFGGIFGVFGMFIGVPVFAVIYAAIKTFVSERLKKKQLPSETSFYLESDYHSDDFIKNTGKEIKFVKKTFENVYVEGKGKRVIVTIDKDDNSGNKDEAKSDDKSGIHIDDNTNIVKNNSKPGQE